MIVALAQVSHFLNIRFTLYVCFANICVDVLGQLQFPKFCPKLAEILACETEDLLVRHESAESLGAIGDPEYLPILTKFSTHEAPEIAETCQIAVDLIKWKQNQKEKEKEGSVGDHQQQQSKGTSGVYLSHDPAPPLTRAELELDDGQNETKTLEAVDGTSFPHQAPLTVPELRAVLLDTSRSLFHRYRAMFSLRNANNDAAALAIADGFADESALFRHEIAYVLGQMQRRSTIPALTAVLRKPEEHRMVRHEAAEALGAIGGPDTEAVLKEFESDAEDVVRESALVALDAMDYWANFQ